MEERGGGGLTPGEGSSHGGLSVAARWREADDGDCLAADGDRGRGRDRGPLGPSGPRGQVGWAMVAGFAGYAFTVGRRFLLRAQVCALLSGLGWQSGAG
jgi:hypothetical protein